MCLSIVIFASKRISYKSFYHQYVISETPNYAPA